MKRLLAVLLCALALGACSGDDPTGPDETPESLVGRYTLVRVNGDSLPVVLRDDSVRITITAGYYNLNNDETFTYGLSYTVARNGASTPQSDTGLGFWAQNNDAVLLAYADDSFPDAATVAGRNMYMTSFATTYVFRRE
jgi:hypothetical protein